MTNDDNHSAAHRDLVKALGEELALGEGAQWLESAEWAEAVDRARLKRFPDVPRDEAFRAVGQLLCERYLASEVGALVLQSIKLMPVERVLATFMPAMAARLRPGFSWNWEPGENGGVIRVIGPRVNPPQTTLGFFEVMLEQVQPSAKMSVGRVGAGEFELHVRW